MSGICLPIDADSTSLLPKFPAAQNRVADSLMLSALPGRPLGGRSGVRLGAEPTVSTTATTWTVTPFSCAVDPGAALTIGPYRVAFLANESGTITAADASNQRVDILYVQVPDDPAPSGAANRVATLGYTAGIPGVAGGAIGAAGGRPATPARSMLLGTITVPKAGGGSPAFAAAFPYLSAPGGEVPVRSAAERDALTTPFKGLRVQRLDLGGSVERYDGASWINSLATMDGVGGAVAISAHKTLNIIPGSGSQVAWSITGWASAPVVSVTLLSAFAWNWRLGGVTSTQVNVFVTNGVSALPDSTGISLHVIAHGIPSTGVVPTI